MGFSLPLTPSMLKLPTVNDIKGRALYVSGTMVKGGISLGHDMLYDLRKRDNYAECNN